MPAALGIDVGIRRGLDLVLLAAGSSTPTGTWRRTGVEELPALLAEHRPDVVAIDAPPAWAAGGRMRRTEWVLRRVGIQSYATPWDAERARNPFYDWMRAGFLVFEAAEAAGYPRYRLGGVRGTAIEVFPHASAVALAGTLPPPGGRKDRWRRSVLRALGVDPEALRSPDQVDAALAALTGLLALEGRCTAPGDPEEGVIVVPVPVLPDRPFARTASAGTGGQ